MTIVRRASRPALAILASVALALGLGGCAKSPGEQCLDSFRLKLKDPDSGKVIDFKEKTLAYTATNSYGARIQKKALCKQGLDGSWYRDYSAEYLEAMEYVLRIAQEYGACVKERKRSEKECANGPIVQNYVKGWSPERLADLALEALHYD